MFLCHNNAASSPQSTLPVLRSRQPAMINPYDDCLCQPVVPCFPRRLFRLLTMRRPRSYRRSVSRQPAIPTAIFYSYQRIVPLFQLQLFTSTCRINSLFPRWLFTPTRRIKSLFSRRLFMPSMRLQNAPRSQQRVVLDSVHVLCPR